MYDYKTLTAHIDELLKRIEILENKIKDTSTNTEEKDPTPYTIGSINKNPLRISDIGTTGDGSILWNDSELNSPPLYTRPPDPNKGYNKHFHTQYAGGALDINAFEIIEYDIDWLSDPTHSPDSQQFWKDEPKILQVQNSKNEMIEKIGNIALVFDADLEQWGASSFEIDIEKCYFVKKDENGDIEIDENGVEMKAPIFNVDETKTSIIWDAENECWRFHAIFAELPVTP